MQADFKTDGPDISPHIPYLRRFGRALTGAQERGDSLVMTALEDIIGNPAVFRAGPNTRAALYRAFLRAWSASEGAAAGGATPSGIRSTRDANSDTISASVDYFEGDFGKLALIPSQFLHAGVNPYTIVETVASGVSSFKLYDGQTGTETNRVKALTSDGNTSGTITVSAANLDAKKAAILAAANNALTSDNLVITAASSSTADRNAAATLAKYRASLHLDNAKCKGFIIPWDMLEIRYGGNIAQVRELTENGGGPRRMMEAMAALLVHSPLTFGMFDYKTNNA